MTNTNLLRIIGEKLTKILLNPFVEMQENIKYNEKKINISQILELSFLGRNIIDLYA